MNTETTYYVVLFRSVSHTLLAEKLFKKNKVSYKIIPVPRHISSDCGVCIRFNPDSENDVKKMLTDHVEFEAIRRL